MANLPPPPKLQFFDANGNPLSGGKLYTYAAGTTTPLATYTDSSGGTPNTNPVILDSRGEANIWLGSAVYKFKLTTSADSEIWTVDNIASYNYDVLAALAASGGSSLVGFIQSGAGATARTVQAKLRESISVKDFGAVGNGVTDDTAAIQAAVSAATAGTTINFPNGIYIVTSTITVSTPAVCLKGMPNPLYSTVPTIRMTTGSNFMFDLTSAGAIFDGLKLEGNGGVYGAGATVNGIRCTGSNGTDCDNYINNCLFESLNKCIELKGKNLVVQNTIISNSLYGIYLDRNAAVAADFRGLSVTNTRFHSLGGASTAAYGIYVVSYPTEANFRELIFVGNYVDDSYAAIYGCINSATITGNMFTRMRGAGSTIEIDLTNSSFTANLRNIVISGNSLFCNDTTNTSTGIKLISTCLPLIANNELNRYQYHGISLSGISDFLINGNFVYLCGASASNLYDAINVSGTTVARGIISSNRIFGAGTGRSGIYIQSTNNPGTNNRNLLSDNFINLYTTPIVLSASNVANSNTFGTAGVLDCVKNSALGTSGTFTLTPSVDSPIQRQAGTLTADVTVNMATSNIYDGAYFKVIRTGGGAFTFTVDLGAGGSQTLTQNQYIETIFSSQAGAWLPVSKGSVV